MLRLNNKGITLVEMLIVVALIGLITPVIFAVFIQGVQDYSGINNYMDQQNKVVDVIRYIRQDVDGAEKYKIVNSNPSDPFRVDKVVFEMTSGEKREWRFESNKLILNINSGSDRVIVNEIDTTKSKFQYINTSGNERLVLNIKPERDSDIKNKARSIQDVIITEFSVRYKVKLP
ncbi:MAG: PulJ/GspJ family protein [Bacillota bacterium]